MSKDTILVTGGFGCIGAETTKWIVRNTDADLVVCARRVDESRVARVFEGIDRSRIRFVIADVSRRDDVDRMLGDHGVTHVVHFAALQTPDCNADRDAGLQTNLAGTQNLIESMKRNGEMIRRFVFASSVAVYGPRDSYPQNRVPMLAEPNPVNVYGIWKLAGEHLARLFHDETGIATASIRPGVLFGPGRDAGLTSTPTTAMKCVALGIPYQIPFRSRQDYMFAPDVGAAFAAVCLEPFQGYAAFTLPGVTRDSESVVRAIHQAATELGVADRFAITIGSDEVPFICDLEYAPFLDAFPAVTPTAFGGAVRGSLETFLEQVKEGRLTTANI